MPLELLKICWLKRCTLKQPSPTIFWCNFWPQYPLPGLSSLMARTVQWGAWLEIGMAAANPSTFKHLAQKGISMELGWFGRVPVSRAGFVPTIPVRFIVNWTLAAEIDVLRWTCFSTAFDWWQTYNLSVSSYLVRLSVCFSKRKRVLGKHARELFMFPGTYLSATWAYASSEPQR